MPFVDPVGAATTGPATSGLAVPPITSPIVRTIVPEAWRGLSHARNWEKTRGVTARSLHASAHTSWKVNCTQPPAVALCIGDTGLEIIEGPRGIHLIEGSQREGIRGTRRFGVRAIRTAEATPDVAEQARTAVPARGGGLLDIGSAGREGIREGSDRETPRGEIAAVGADLPFRFVDAHLGEIGMVDRVAADLVARILQRCQIGACHVARGADEPGGHVEGGLHAVRAQRGKRLELIGVGVVEGQTDDGARGGVGRRCRLRRDQTAGADGDRRDDGEAAPDRRRTEWAW
nr:hypothetical protein [Microbacterium proteolyticum]